MSSTSYSDIYDEVNIMKLVGQDWEKAAKIMQSGIVKLDTRPMKGTQVSELRQTLFQDTSGQALKAGDTISSQKEVQARIKHPIIWRYQSADQPDVIDEIKNEGYPSENTAMAQAIVAAAAQYLDDSAIATIRGTGAVLTENQNDDNTNVISLDNLVDTKAKLGDEGVNLNGGSIALRSEPYWKLVTLGLIAATSNTYGNAAQDEMVRNGQLPQNVLGLTPMVDDKFTDLTSNKYYVYLIGANSLVIRGSSQPIVKVAESTVNKKFSTITNFKVNYAIGFDGMNYGGTAAEDVSDTDLATSGNWALGAAYSKNIPLARLHIKTA